MSRPLWLHRLAARLARSVDARISYAQEGEDLLLDAWFDAGRRGFYVDVGAHHPWRFSNTARLHARGWRGINIDPEPGSMAPFRAARPNDVNLEVAVGAAAGTRRFFRYSDAALNGFGDRSAELARTPYRLLGSIDVPVRPLRDILSEHAPAGGVDLLSIDVEGAELEVLESSDWLRWIPEIVLMEARGRDSVPAGAAESAAVRFLRERGYDAVAGTTRTIVFRHASARAGVESPAAASSRRNAGELAASSSHDPVPAMRPSSKT